MNNIEQTFGEQLRPLTASNLSKIMCSISLKNSIVKPFGILGVLHLDLNFILNGSVNDFGKYGNALKLL